MPSPIYLRFSEAASRTPEKPALVIGDRCYSYRALQEEVVQLANGLSAAGARPGEHVGVLLPNCAEFVIVLLACARQGLVVIPQSMGLSGEALENTFRTARINHMLAWAGTIGNLTPACLALAEHGIRVSIGGESPHWAPLQHLMAAGKANPQPAPELPPDAPFLMVLTSGSTGQPKPILLSQHTKLLRAEAAAQLYDVTADDVTLAATPLYHSLAQRLVLIPLMSGGTSVLMAHFTPANWIVTVDRENVSFSIAVSSQLKQILASLITGQRTLPSLRSLVSSSALLDDATKKALLQHLQCDFHECYGASEIAIATNLSPEGARHKLGSVGTAIPGTKVRILDEDGNLAPLGSPGEIICQTPMRYSGYYGQPATTAAAQWGDGYFRTGDLGRLDNEGFLYFLGRIKDIIITGGVNVYPKDIEDIVASHPGVAECAAIPLPDDNLGEVVGIVMAFNDPTNPPEIRHIQRLCMQRLGDFQQPRAFFVLPELPKNAMGKLDKPGLRKTYSTPRNPG